MSTVTFQNWNDLTPEGYDKLREIVHWDTERPDGIPLQVATFGEDGVLRMSVVDSAELFNNFVRYWVFPVFQKLGTESFPDVIVSPVRESI